MASYISIRPATARDVETLARFNAAMAMETEKLRLSLPRLRRGVRAVLRNQEHGFYIVAIQNGTVIGQLLVTFEWSDWRNGQFWWIQSVYVVPDHRRKGVMRALFTEVRRRAKKTRRICGLRLYVEKENQTAKRTYEKLGLTATHYLVCEDDFVLRR